MVFKLDEFIDDMSKSNLNNSIVESNDFSDFYLLCSEIKTLFKDKADSKEFLLTQKKAIQGYEEEVQYYLNEIETYLQRNNKEHIKYPTWYDELSIGIFHEIWGLHGIYLWTKDKTSSSAKIIGEKIFFLNKGRQVLQKQRISQERLNKLITALLLLTPEKRINEDYHEVYMIDGTRIEILNNTKETTVVFRKYTIQDYSFETQAELNTIDAEMIPLMKDFVKCGFNVNFIGPVRSGKTTAMTTYQSYEDPSLEGTLIETDPEIPLHLIMPESPITQIVVDGDELDKVIKPLMRSDADYLVMGEARDGKALRLMLLVTKKGTRRVKATFHTGDPGNFCFDVAQEISNLYGGDVWAYMIQVAKGFQYLFEFAQMPYNKSVKKLKGIYEIRLDPETLVLSTHQIVKYNSETNDWEYSYDIGDDVQRIGNEEDPKALENFKNELQRLANLKPMKGNHIVVSPYSKLMMRGN